MTNRQSGFSLIEVLIATVVLLVAVAGSLAALMDAIHASQSVTQMADTQENLRAGMNYIVRDLVEAGEGIPQGGITIPNNGLSSNGAPPSGNSNINRPGLSATGADVLKFPSSYVTLPAITPGYQVGFPEQMPNPNNPYANITSPTNTDVITLIYADTTLVDNTTYPGTPHTLDEFPIKLAEQNNSTGPGCAPSNPGPAPAGSITVSGTTLTVTFDATCVNINQGNTGLHAGDLIMFESNASADGIYALMYVSSVSGQTVQFLAGDPFNLNGTGLTAGTFNQLDPNTAAITATRIWMITYYLDTVTNPLHPVLMRQVNFAVPQEVGEVIEDLAFSYDLTEPSDTPPVSTVSNIVYPDSPELIRKVNVFLAARSETPLPTNRFYFHNNFTTSVNIRSLCFYNQFN
ncbi:MAG TPA: prepilin-type N-terminal cleavage/methylation domain-containing protein [Candidatus Acidoferrum sp.]|nr:prepilin-type N-terminal cleavage/methylation domain-containing protein [Candidatus Acidoferrum sp.]